MSTTITLTLRQAPALRVDLRGVTPAALAALSVGEVERLSVTHGTQMLQLAELFGVVRSDSAGDVDELRLIGDLARFDRVGWQMAGGRVFVGLVALVCWPLRPSSKGSMTALPSASASGPSWRAMSSITPLIAPSSVSSTVAD